MIELLITSFPFLFRLWQLRRRGMPVTFYNVHVALFIWLVLAFGVFVALFYYYPKSYTGIVPFQIIPVVAERGGTVTSVNVGVRQHVEAGQVLFTVENSSEKASVVLAEQKLDEVERVFASAQAQVKSARAAHERALALLANANQRLEDQEELKRRQSSAFLANAYDRAVASQAAAAADAAAAASNLEAAENALTAELPARRQSAAAALDQARVDLEKTTVRSLVPGVVEQLMLSVGNRGAQFATNPAMIIVPDDQRHRVVAGFSQVARSVLHVGMPAEIACDATLNLSMRNSIIPARVVMIQDVISSGQLSPSGRLLEPAERAQRGDIVVYLEPIYPEQRAKLVNGAGCMVQTYTNSLPGFAGHAIGALGIVKATLFRIKAWVALIAGIGLGAAH